MYCRYCGVKLRDDVQFCTACGKKTVKLHPRQNAPIDEKQRVLQAVDPRPKTALTALFEKVRTFVSASFPLHMDIPPFAREFDTRMWTFCGIMLGLEVVALVEIISSAASSFLLFSFLEETPTVLLVAWLINLIIAEATVIAGYNYRRTDEYREAVKPRAPLTPAPAVATVATAALRGAAPTVQGSSGDAAGDKLPTQEPAGAVPDTPREEAAPATAEPNAGKEKTGITETVADIIAELEGMSLTL